MKHKLLTFFLLCLSFFLVGNSSTVYANDDTIRIWFGAIEEEKKALEEIANTFKAETGIKVEVVQKLEIFTVPSAFVNNAELPERPDIIYMQAPDIGGLVKSGYLVPLAISDDLNNRFNEVAFDAFTYNNEVYGVGYNNSTSGLLYNKDLISSNELPTTWDELFDLAHRLTIKNDKNEIIQRGLYLNATDMWFNYPLIREFGSYYYGKLPNGTYNAYDIGLNNDGMLEYVAKIKELKEEGLVLNNPSKKDYGDIISSFADGKVAMFFYGLWSAHVFQQVGINYGIAPLPKGKNQKIAQPLTTVEGFVINKYTRNLEGSKALLNYLLTDENQQKLIEAGNRYHKKTGERNPTNKAVCQSSYIQDNEILKSLAVIGLNVEPFPNIPEGTLWYNQDVTINTFKTIFFGDRNGNPVDAKYKLDELVDLLSKNVALMNKQPTHLEIEWWVYLIIFVAIALIIVMVWQKNKKKAKRKLYKIKYDPRITLIAWTLLLPILVLIITFYVFPIFHNIYLSFTDYSGINLKNYGLIGFYNYYTIFTEGIKGLLSMTLWTIAFALIVVTLSFIFGTILAMVLDSVKVQIAKIYRIIYILPWVIPTVIILLMWQGLLETEGGLINQLLGLIGIGKVPWLTHPFMAKVSTILVMVWFSFPYFMVIAFGFLKSIPKDYYEAAKVDGANRRYILTKIVLPLLFRALLPMLIMSFIMQFSQFGVYMLTQGGPASDILGRPGATDLLITYVFNTAFNTKRYALAASYSVIIFFFIATFAVIMMKINKKLMN